MYILQRLKITSVYNNQIKSFITLQQLTILTTICRIYLKTKSLCLNDINNFCILNDIITVRRFTFFKEIIQVCYDVRWKEFLLKRWLKKYVNIYKYNNLPWNLALNSIFLLRNLQWAKSWIHNHCIIEKKNTQINISPSLT